MSFDGIKVLAVETVFRMAEVLVLGVPFDTIAGLDTRRETDDGRFNDVVVGFGVLTDVAILLMVRFPMPDTARRTIDNFDVTVAAAVETVLLAERSTLFGLGIFNRDTIAGEAIVPKLPRLGRLPILPMLPMLPRLARRFDAVIDERTENKMSIRVIRLIPLISPCLPFKMVK